MKNKKKQNTTASRTNVPFLYRHGPPSPLPHECIGVSLLIHPQKNAVLNLFLVNKQEKQKGRGFTSLFFFLFCFKGKKKLLLHWLDFTSRQKKHSYNFLHSTAINRSRRGHAGPPSKREARPSAKKASLLAKEHFLKRFLEKNRRGIYLMVKKNTIKSF